MLRGKIAKRPEEARKGLSPNLGKNTSNLPTKESNKKKPKNIKNRPSSKNQKALHNYIIEKKICCPSVAFQIF